MEVNGQLHITSALHLGERVPDNHGTEGLVGPTVGMVVVEQRIFSYPCREMNPDRPGRELTLYRLCYLGPYRTGVSYINKHIASNNSELFIYLFPVHLTIFAIVRTVGLQRRIIMSDVLDRTWMAASLGK